MYLFSHLYQDSKLKCYQFWPSAGENVMQQSVKLLQVKDPLFKRMGASRLARFAIDGNAYILRCGK